MIEASQEAKWTKFIWYCSRWFGSWTKVNLLKLLSLLGAYLIYSLLYFFCFFYFAAGITYHCLSNQIIRDICVRGLVERNLPGYVHSFFCRITLIQQLKIMRTELLIYLSSFILDLPFYCYRPCAWSVFWTIEFIHGTWLNKFQVIPLFLALQKK